jgi:hypothetical protein
LVLRAPPCGRAVEHPTPPRSAAESKEEGVGAAKGDLSGDVKRAILGSLELITSVLKIEDLLIVRRERGGRGGGPP